MNAFLYLLIFLIFIPSLSIAQETGQNLNNKSITIPDGTEYRFENYSIEYFSLQEGDIRCLNVLNSQYKIMKQFCKEKGGRDRIRDNIGEIFYIDDDFAFSIRHAMDEHAGAVVYSTSKISYEIISSKWFSYGLKLTSTSPKPTIIAYPGDTFSIDLKLKDEGDKGKLKETYKIYLVVPEKWNAIAKISNIPVSFLELANDDEALLTGEVKISDGVFERYVVSFVVEGGDKSRPKKVRYDVPVTLGNEIFSSKLSSSVEKVIASPGEEIDIDLTLENKGYMEKLYYLNAVAPKDWKITFYKSNLEISSIKVNGKSSVTLNAKIELPADIRMDELSLLFKAENNYSNADYQLKLVVDQDKESTKLRTSTPEIIATPGKEIQINLDLENNGHTPEYYRLRSFAPEGWNINFYRNEFKVPRVLLSGGDTISLTAKFNIPDDTPLGEYHVVFITEKEDNTNTRQNVTVFVEGEYNLGLELSKFFTRIVAGETEVITARIANPGKNVVTGLEMEIETPEDWTYSISPKRISNIDAGNVGDFSISLNPPPDTSMGDYFIKIKAKSDQTESKEISLRITIEQKNSLGFIGIIIAILSVVSLFIIYRKFGRR